MLTEKAYRKIRRRSEFLCNDGGISPKYCTPQGTTAASDAADINHEVIRRKIKLHRRTEKVRRLDYLYDALVEKQTRCCMEYLDERIPVSPKTFVKVTPDKGIIYTRGRAYLKEGPVSVMVTKLRKSDIDKFFRYPISKIQPSMPSPFQKKFDDNANGLPLHSVPCQLESSLPRKNFVETEQAEKMAMTSDDSLMSNSVFSSGEISDAEVYFPDQVHASRALPVADAVDSDDENKENKFGEDFGIFILSPGFSDIFNEDSNTVDISNQLQPSIPEDTPENVVDEAEREGIEGNNEATGNKSFTLNESFNVSNDEVVDSDTGTVDISNQLLPSIPEDTPENVVDETEREGNNEATANKSFALNESFNVSDDEDEDCDEAMSDISDQLIIAEDIEENASETEQEEKKVVPSDLLFTAESSVDSSNDEDSDADILDITIAENEFDF